MKKLLLLICMTAAFAYAKAQILPLQRTELFVTTDTSAHPYRIPAIVESKKGTLVAVSDYRPCNADIGFGRVDLKVRRGKRNGKYWTAEQTLHAGTGVKGAVDCGYGDAAMVSDQEHRNQIMLLCVCGSTVYSHSTTTRQNPNRIARLNSNDGGRTWSSPKEITESIYSLFDNSKHGPIQSLFVGSGRLCQSKKIKVDTHHRIYAPLCARPNGNRVIYSDNFGLTWHTLGDANALPAPHGDEPKCVELPNGDVLLSSRAYGGRIFNIFHYTNVTTGEGKWMKPAFSGKDNHGTFAWRNACNGGILIVNARNTNTHQKCHVVLQSIPLGPGRVNVGVYYKPLYTQTDYASPGHIAEKWFGPVQLTNRPSGYSEMVLQRDGKIGVFMEECCHNANYTNVYLKYSLSQLTNGRFE